MKWSSIRQLSWAPIIGSILLFGSWITQNYLLIKWGNEVQFLNKAAAAITHSEINVDQWMILLISERSKESPRDEIVNTAALKVILHTASLLSWAESRITTKKETIRALLRERDELRKHAVERFNAGDTDELVKIVNKLNKYQNDVGKLVQEAEKKRRYDLLVKENVANILFLILYICGSLILGYAYIVSDLKKRGQSAP